MKLQHIRALTTHALSTIDEKKNECSEIAQDLIFGTALSTKL